MARVYVSSTYSDLRDYRESAYRALRQLGHDVVAMEDSVAADQRPLDRCLAEVAASDVYVGIFAYRYGYVPEDGNPEGRSITELEYRHARALGLPCLVFLTDPAVPWPPQFIDGYSQESDRIRALREELARTLTVGYFSSPSELAHQVVAAVSEALRGDSPAAQSQDADGLTLWVVSSHVEERLVNQLHDHLDRLQQAGLVSSVTNYQVRGESRPRPFGHADIVLVMLSTDLLGSGYLESEEFLRLGDQHAARELRLIPVVLRPISLTLLPPPLLQMQLLPSSGRPVTEYESRDSAFVEVVEGVRLACLEIVARRQRTPSSPSPQPSARTSYRLVDVFKESGVPLVTFVEPDDFYQLKLDLEQPGRGMVIEGPSGVGKTTALHMALEQLDAVIAGGFELLSARRQDHVTRIEQLSSWHHGLVVIDDFHRLAAALRAVLVDYMKQLADTEPEDRKLVIVGIPGTGQTLAHVSFDIATRIGFLSLGTVSDDKVLEMVEKGEAALNVELIGKSEIVRTAAGSLNVAQILCRHVIARAHIRETQTVLTPVDSDLPRAIGTAMDRMALKFGGVVQSFAALDGPAERLCIELLMELAAAKDGTLSLWQLAERRPDLGPGIRQFAHGEGLAALRDRHPDYDKHLWYDRMSGVLVADDPQFTFYLRQLNPDQLALSAGKRPQTQRLGIFVSYSRRDAEWLELLRVHLKPLEREGLIDLWDDTRIRPGSLWREQLNAALDLARVAIILISADFLASDFIADNELPPLLEAADRDGCTVMPLLVRPSLFDEVAQLSRFQAVPRDGSTLNELSRAEQEKLLVKLAKEVASLAKGRV